VQKNERVDHGPSRAKRGRKPRRTVPVAGSTPVL
jgi:hypothetical protein